MYVRLEKACECLSDTTVKLIWSLYIIDFFFRFKYWLNNMQWNPSLVSLNIEPIIEITFFASYISELNPFFFCEE